MSSKIDRAKRETLSTVVENCYLSKRSLLDGIAKDRRFHSRLTVETTLRGFLALSESEQARIYDLGVEMGLKHRQRRTK